MTFNLGPVKTNSRRRKAGRNSSSLSALTKGGASSFRKRRNNYRDRCASGDATANRYSLTTLDWTFLTRAIS